MHPLLLSGKKQVEVVLSRMRCYGRSTMKGLVFYGKENLSLGEIPDVRPAEGEVLLRVRASGICGSDLSAFLGKSDRRIPPMVMGHEFAGVVEELGPGNHRFCIGDRVVVQPIVFCGECEFCSRGLTNFCENKKMFGVMDINGSMATHIAVPESVLYMLPEDVDFANGAMAEPLAVAYSAAANVNLQDRDVLIVGAGTIGLLLLEVVLLQQPHMVIVADLNQTRLNLAVKLGATKVVNAQEQDLLECVFQNTGGKGVDYAFEAVGLSTTVQQALSALRQTGTCIWIGNSEKMISISMQDVVTRALRIKGTYAYSHKEFGQAVNLVSTRQVDLAPVISKKVNLEEGAEMFRRQTRESGDLIKVMIET
jgi:2-desacetyl-2-hydroxyethyl bacteriochlorophyllide A dehydrogenase